MSEFQYYEWQAIDRLLNADEQDAVSRLSSHIDVSSSRAAVTYQYGDFKHDPDGVLARFFDAHLYVANWGTRHLLFRFPAGLLAEDVLAPYRVHDLIGFRTKGEFDVLEIDLNEEEGFGWVECDTTLSDLVPLRSELLQGDYRFLYLAWLKAISLKDDDPASVRKGAPPKPSDPPVPPGLNQLSPALRRFQEFFDIDPCLVAAAAEASLELPAALETDYPPLVGQLTREECDGFLCRVARGDPTASLELQKRLRSFVPRQTPQAPARRTIGQLLSRAKEIEQERDRRQKNEARKKHVEEMESLAAQEVETWKRVEILIGMKQPKQYDAAVQQLTRLKELSEFRQTQKDFRTRLETLCERYRSRPGLQYRVQQAKLLGPPASESGV